MASKKAIATKRNGNWKFPLSLLFGGVLILTACLVVRHYWRPGSASAQTPPRQTPRQFGGTATPANTARTNTTKTPTAGGSTKLKVMAVVNGKQITRQQLAQEALRRYGKEVTESLVNKHLILAACNRLGIVITEKDVQEEVSRIAAKFGLSADRWLSMLQQERELTPQQYRNDIVWPTLALRRLAAKEIQVTPQEVQKVLDSELGPQVQVRLISVGKRDKAEQLRAQALAKPEEFGTLAKNNSEDRNSASAYGLIPPIRRHVGDPQVEQAAFRLREGEISPVVAVANQYIILKCERQLPARQVSSEALAKAHQRIVDHLRDKKLRAVAAQIFKKMQDEAQVVNVYNDERLKSQYPGVAALINGRQLSIRELSEECITRHGKDVLAGEINRQLLIQELARRRVVVEENDIDQEIKRAADANGYADIQKWLAAVTKQDKVSVDLYVRDAVWPSVALKKMVAPQVKVGDDDMQKGFEANYGPRVEALAIVLSSHRQAQQVWEMARNNPSDQFFGQLAKQYSIEPVSAANGGKVPPIQRYGGRELIEKEAFRLKAGEISGIIAVGGEKYVILRCRGRTKPIVQDFEAVREHLYKDIYEKKLRIAMAKEFDRLRETAQIDNFLAGTAQSGKKPAAGKTRRPGAGNPYTLPGTADRRTTLPAAPQR